MPDENNAMIRILIFISALLFLYPLQMPKIYLTVQSCSKIMIGILYAALLLKMTIQLKPLKRYLLNLKSYSSNKNYWVSVLAEVNEQQNENLILKIEKIDEVHLDETCHLLEALKILKIESNHHSRFITNSSISRSKYPASCTTIIIASAI